MARERIRDLHAHKSWEEFNASLACTPPGNNGNIAMFFFEEEITPKVKGVFRFDAEDNIMDSFEQSAIEVRAIIEGQFLAKRAHAEKLGFTIGKCTHIYLTC